MKFIINYNKKLLCNKKEEENKKNNSNVNVTNLMKGRNSLDFG